MAISHWVDGKPYTGTSTKTIPVENPATGKVVDELLMASKEDLDHVVEVAKVAQAKWARVSLAKRVDIMFKFRQLMIEHADELALSLIHI